ncbi:hypothetical protein ACFOLF_03670 [Paenibacillus sepulcri]|uniref:Uncharacterized protein n=1 Tax=Paenibacillus sepulcri TaxID=359917 RepID=A0ABS7C2D5_9BACL|nr:hypothetical protein [Paenibacillus sepulcri]
MGILYEIINRTNPDQNKEENKLERPCADELVRQSYYRADKKLRENLLHADKGLNKA